MKSSVLLTHASLDRLGVILQNSGMANRIDPEELHSFAKIADEYGYNPEHLRQLAAQKRLKAWLIDDALWVTTRKNFDEYLKSRSSRGRRPNTEKHNASRARTKK